MTTFIQEDQLLIEEISLDGYEKVYKIEDQSVGLKAIVCLHDLTLGPALGGTRIYPYSDFESALTDVKRLAKGMTYKSALTESAWGGGKSVIIADPSKDKTDELLMAFGRAVERLGGVYICAEDVGCSPRDVGVIGSVTKYAVGLMHEKSSGNPSHFTAWGVYRGIQAALQALYGSDSVKDKVVAIQGLGSVGSILADLLFWNGAKLIVTDVQMGKAAELAKKYSAKLCAPDEILSVSCDVLAPCALGGILNEKTIPLLNCKIVAGAANNQLLLDSDGDALVARGILYAPDFVINAGGLINVTEELTSGGYDPMNARNKVDSLYNQLLTIFEMAKQTHSSTHRAATALGDYRLEHKIGLRVEEPCFHHSL